MIKNILFLCTGNSCRSIMAEVLLNQLGKNTYQAYSAGSFPTGSVNPDSLNILKENQLLTRNLSSKSWNYLSHIYFDIVITVCDNAANETCPIYLGSAIKAHWPIADPDKVVGENRLEAFALAFEQLKQHINKLLKLSEISSDNLNHIGKTSL